MNYSGDNMTGHDFSGQDLTGYKFRGAILTGCNFSGANLSGADFSGAGLRGANMSGANLSGARFTSATMTGADLRGVTVDDATMISGATVSDAIVGAAAIDLISRYADSVYGTPVPDRAAAVAAVAVMASVASQATERLAVGSFGELEAAAQWLAGKATRGGIRRTCPRSCADTTGCAGRSSKRQRRTGSGTTTHPPDG